MPGAMGVDCSSKRSISRDVPVSLAVLRAVFSIFTHCSMNPLDQWKCRDEVIWSMDCLCRNHLNSSTVKGGVLSEYRMLGDHTGTWLLEILTRDWALLEVMWNKKGYLLNRLAINR